MSALPSKEARALLRGIAHDLVIDLFAGGGGTSAGLEDAINRPVDVALNHDPLAISVHARNHPNTVHITEDIWKVRPRDVVGRRKVWILWASPDCKHFSSAKGSKPLDQNIRMLAEAVIEWVRELLPEFLFLENELEFQKYGPLGPDGRPIKAREGEKFQQFVGKLDTLGYSVEWRVLDASEYGVPTKRRRLYLVALCAAFLTRHFGSFGKPQNVKNLSSDMRGPLGTVTARDHHSITAATLLRLNHDDHGIDIRRPLPTITADGFHFAEVRAFLTSYFGSDGQKGKGQDVRSPMRTVTTKPRLGLVEVYGDPYAVADIGFRMLRPDPELLRAQFGEYAEGYDLQDAVKEEDKNRMVGNSVCPRMAKLVVAANINTQLRRAA